MEVLHYHTLLNLFWKQLLYDVHFLPTNIVRQEFVGVLQYQEDLTLETEHVLY